MRPSQTSTDAAVAAFDRRSDYDGRADAAPWLYGIVSNLLRGWFRSAARRELLYACAELTYDQIARGMGVPIGTVRSRIHRARTRVRVHLETLELSHEH